jgi:hypothetical protein
VRRLSTLSTQFTGKGTFMSLSYQQAIVLRGTELKTYCIYRGVECELDIHSFSLMKNMESVRIIVPCIDRTMLSVLVPQQIIDSISGTGMVELSMRVSTQDIELMRIMLSEDVNHASKYLLADLVEFFPKEIIR